MLETGNTRRLGFELDSLEREIASSVSRKLEINLLRIENLEAVVKGNNPERLYSKGWATVRGKNGKLLRSISDTAVEETIEVILRDGSLMAKTEMIIPERTDNE